VIAPHEHDGSVDVDDLNQYQRSYGLAKWMHTHIIALSLSDRSFLGASLRASLVSRGSAGIGARGIRRGVRQMLNLNYPRGGTSESASSAQHE